MMETVLMICGAAVIIVCAIVFCAGMLWLLLMPIVETIQEWRKSGSLFCLALVMLVPATSHAETIIASFTAPWCPYCQRIKPDVIALQKAGYDIRFADVDLPATKSVPGFSEVKQIPVAFAIDTETMKVVDRLPNARMNPATLKAFVAKHLKPKAKAVPASYQKSAGNPDITIDGVTLTYSAKAKTYVFKGTNVKAMYILLMAEDGRILEKRLYDTMRKNSKGQREVYLPKEKRWRLMTAEEKAKLPPDITPSPPYERPAVEFKPMAFRRPLQKASEWRRATQDERPFDTPPRPNDARTGGVFEWWINGAGELWYRRIPDPRPDIHGFIPFAL